MPAGTSLRGSPSCRRTAVGPGALLLSRSGPPTERGGRKSGLKASAMSAASKSVPGEFVDLGHKLADAAAVVTAQHFRSRLVVEHKGDESPVTQADRQAELAMCSLIEQALPNHGVYGEEGGMQHGSGEGSEYLWILDPIDGTKSFITGKPLFGTLIALVHKGIPILGIIDQPVLKERWVGIQGAQTTLNGKCVATRQCPSLSEAYLYATTPDMFRGDAKAAFKRLRGQVRPPLFGCDCYAYGLLASGFCDLVVEADMMPYDYMALVPVVEGAGGVMTDWQGRLLRWRGAGGLQEALEASTGEVIAAGDAKLHERALAMLRSTS
ncbi:unnamed protein product [Ostreobium quekettii]|uniref:histidinol-phosphatase n=1 Tax=Ostreobium quekettii TaxID=121088 RepID=A0A8S1J250_9CHLO|nr:unnamed protein product [Ostreobium quekettii]|eukprot:evm.model.scf_1445.4 EVM.evm.TU.scf_1445.4   scf_1445:11940-14297(-)